MFLSQFKTATRALLVTAMVAGTAIAGAAPVQAQSFNFNFGINGGGSSFSYGIGSGGKKFRRECLTNREIRNGLRDAGFYDIEIGSSSNTRVRVVATWEENDRDYSMRVNRCSGKVTDIQRIRGGGGGGGGSYGGGGGSYGGSGGPGMNFQFSY